MGTMADTKSGGDTLGALIMVVLVVMTAAIIVMALMSAGALYGAWTGLVNYGRSLRESVRPERAPG
jgi:hypothetical protein